MLIHSTNDYTILCIIRYFEFIVCFNDMTTFPLVAHAEGNPYLNNLSWVIYDKLSMIIQIDAYCGPHPGRAPCCQRVHCPGCAAAVFEGELQQILQLACSNPTSCEQVSKHLVVYIIALIVLSPYRRPSNLRLIAIALVNARDLILLL